MESFSLQRPMRLKLFLVKILHLCLFITVEVKIKNWKEGERMHLTKKEKKFAVSLELAFLDAGIATFSFP